MKESNCFMYKIFFTVCIWMFVFSNFSPAGAVEPDDSTRIQIASKAVSIVKGLNGSYSDVLKVLSPAVFPDEVDYLLHKPLDIDVSFPMDSFKNEYCSAVPSEGTVVPLYDAPVFIEIWEKTFRKDGVPLLNKTLVDSVKNSVNDFQSDNSKNKYSYVVNTERKATVNVAAKIVDIENITINSVCEKTWIRMEFVENNGNWWLYSLKRREGDECMAVPEKQRMEYKIATPFFDECGLKQ